MSLKKKDRLVDTALRLFCRYGYRATGIDTILTEAGVAKMTLYNHFGTKEGLILAALEKRDEEHIAWLASETQTRAGAPEDGLLALFDTLDAWFAGDEFHGCPFLKASGEFDDHNDPVHRAALAHKGQLLALIRELADAAGAPDPARIAGEIYMLVEGATVVAQLTGDRSTAARAKQAAEVLLAAG